MEDKEALQSDLDNLVEWSQKWLLAFNIEKCKVMHIAYSDKVYYGIGRR